MPEVFPFCPEREYRDIYEWRTDIIEARSLEQRHAQRLYPKRYLRYTFHLTAKQYATAVGFIRSQFNSDIYVPIWGEHTDYGAISASATTLTFDTTLNDFQANDKALIWQDSDTFEVVTVSAVTDTYLTVSAVAATYTSAFVVPLRTGRISQKPQFQRRPDQYSFLDLEYVFHEDRALDNTGGDYSVDSYLSTDVLIDRSIANSITDSDGWDIVQFDTINKFTRETEYTYPKWESSLAWETLDRAESWAVKKWICSRLGRQKAFFTPDWNDSIVLDANVSSSDTSFDIETVAAGTEHPPYVYFRKTDGTRLYRNIDGATDNGDGTETIDLKVEPPTIPELLAATPTTKTGLPSTDTDSVFATADGLNIYLFDGDISSSLYWYTVTDISDLSGWTLSGSVTAATSGVGTISGRFQDYGRVWTMKPDGTRMYCVGESSSPSHPARITQWDLPTAYDVTTWGGNNAQDGEFGWWPAGGGEPIISEIVIVPDGTALYLLNRSDLEVWRYTFGTAWDVTTLSKDAEVLDVSGELSVSTCDCMVITDDESEIWVGGNGGNWYKYTVDTPTDLSTGSYSGTSVASSYDDAAFYSSSLNALLTAESDNMRAYSASATTFGVDLNAADLDEAGFLRKVRFDTDRIEFRHGANRALEVKANVIEVNDTL